MELTWKQFATCQAPGTIRLIPGMRMLVGCCRGCHAGKSPLHFCIVPMIVWVN